MSTELSRPAQETDSQQVPLPKEIRPIETKIRRRLGKLGSQVIKTNHDIGKLLIEADEKFLPLTKYPFRNIIDWFSERLGIGRRVLYDAKRFAERIDADSLDLLLQPAINWSHVRIMLNHGLDSNLNSWVTKIIENKWTASDLEDEVRAGKPNLRLGSGRRPSPPKNASVGLRQLEQAAGKFQNKLESALFSPSFDLAEEIRNLSPNDVGEDTLLAVHNGVTVLEQLAEVATKDARSLREAMDWIDGVLKKREADEAEKRKKEHEQRRSMVKIPDFSESD